ncbi:MAG: T9SS type A sorting domain-containing protein [Flavobacteriales bacterium]
MKKELILSLSILSVLALSAQETKHVLFLGNSYTAANNLPMLISSMATNTGDVLIYDSNTPGGYRFTNHASSAVSLQKIKADDWDYVVLQAQSQETSWSQSQMNNEVFPYASALADSIRSNFFCSQPLFYMTWGRENGDANNCPFAPWVCTYEGMDDAIKASYLFMAEEHDAEVAPAGAVWRYIRTNYPQIDLYTSDGSHPSMAGSYAVACAFYTSIFKKDPSLITWDSSLSPAIANTIRLAAKQVVFDELSTWDFTQNLAEANFTELINTELLSLTNTSLNSDSVLWNFGDGTTSQDQNPSHSYTQNGDFDVTLINFVCGRQDTISKSLEIKGLDLESYVGNSLKIYPNPVHTNLQINLGSEHSLINIQVFDVAGNSIKTSRFKNQSKVDVDVSDLKSGLYYLYVEWEGQLKRFKFIRN